MLVSVHLPKTAGSSFRLALEKFYGCALMPDYGDLPINKPALKRNTNAVRGLLENLLQPKSSEFKCIHGHFMPLKYLWLNSKTEKKFIVWLRDPIERLASHYFYWKKNYDFQSAGQLRRQVIEENWSLERFCFSVEMRNTYSQFLWGFPINRFDFIGITENYVSDLKYFSENILGSQLENLKVNTNEEQGAEPYINDPDLRSKLELFHQKDMQLYNRALATSNARRKYIDS